MDLRRWRPTSRTKSEAPCLFIACRGLLPLGHDTDKNIMCFGIPEMTHFRVGVIIGTLSKIAEAFGPMGSRLKTRISKRYSAFFAQKFCHGPTVYSYLDTHNSELCLSLSRSGPIAVIQNKAGSSRSPHRDSRYLGTATHPIFPKGELDHSGGRILAIPDSTDRT
jgi:hypothetical protein